MPSKRNNHINLEGGRRKPTFKYAKDDGTTVKQALTLRKKTKNKCREMKNGKNHKGLKRDMKLRRFMRLNNPHKAPS